MKLSLIPGWMTSDLELVRMHHPDSPHTRDIPSPLAQSRFQSIAAAYDLLRNPHLSKPAMHREGDDMYMAEVNRRKAYHARHQGMGVRDWERQQQAMAADVDAGKWWNHDRAILYAFGIIVRADLPISRIHADTRRRLIFCFSDSRYHNIAFCDPYGIRNGRPPTSTDSHTSDRSKGEGEGA